MIRLLGILVLTLALGACSLFGGDEDPNPPAPLPEIQGFLESEEGLERQCRRRCRESAPWVLPWPRMAPIYLPPVRDGRVSDRYDAQKGRRVWRSEMDVGLSAGPAYGSGLVVVVSRDGEVIALDATDGSLKWKSKLNAEVLASPAITRDMVLLRAVDGSMRALQARNGIPAWMTEQDVPRLSVAGNLCTGCIRLDGVGRF